MTNPSATLRLLITYAICIPLAITVGYVLTDPLNYGTLGFLGLILAAVLSPIFIKWHYPLMVLSLGAPIYCFFLFGDPPLWEVMVAISLGIAIVERATSVERNFISVPAMTWPLLFILAVALFTAEMTGGIGLHKLGGSTGGGKKYITLFIGIASYFALTSRPISPKHRNLYIGLYFLSGAIAFIGDLYPALPEPLNYINLLIPPTGRIGAEGFNSTTRLTAVASSLSTVAIYLLARHGLLGTIASKKPWRLPLFVIAFTLSLLGGFRSNFAGFVLLLVVLFFLEGLHRTKYLLILSMAGVVFALVVVMFSNKLPYNMQRAMSFLPLKWDSAPLLDAQGSSEWRFKMWHDLWPKVPEYLVLGKGYALNAEDFSMIEGGAFALYNASHMDSTDDPLAVAGDYHSGPLTTLIPFGIWGALGFLWLNFACMRIVYLNFRYGDPSLRTFNGFMLASCLSSTLFFYFIFGGFQNDVGGFARIAAFSIAMNNGVARKKSAPSRVSSAAKPLAMPLPA